MKKSLINLAGALVLAFSVSNVALADQISGNITFSGRVTMADSSNVATNDVNVATQVTTWLHPFLNTPGAKPVVGDADGDFALYVTGGDAVTITNPWAFNSGALTPFWSVDGFTFDLISSAIISQGGGQVSVTGTGTVTGHGFDPSLGVWNFTSQNPSSGSPARFTFSAATAVPEGGTTALLLGLSLVSLSLAAFRRKSA